MPTITSTNNGSGLDVRGLVDQLVAAEGAPVSARLDRKEVKIQQGLTAMGTFKGALLDFQASLTPLRTPDAFKAITASSSDEDKFEVSADANAVTGSYDIEISQLAQSQKLKSQAFESEFDSIGSGTLSIEFGTVNTGNNSFELNSKIPPQRIEITEDNNSLRGIQEAINQANAGVRASIINDGNGYRLVLNSEKSGNENSLRISVSDDDLNDEDSFGLSLFSYNPVATADAAGNVLGKNLEETAVAKDAIFSIDGISVNSSENTVSSTIPGVTINLKKLTSESPGSFRIAADTTGVKKSIEAFVASYNELNNSITALTGVDPETGTSGPLSGDASVRGIANQIRRQLSTSFNGINEHLGSLSTIGIDTNRDGSLSLDPVKLEQALANHSEEVTHLFSAATSTTDPQITVSSEKVPTINGVFDINIEQTPSSGFLNGGEAGAFPITIEEGSNDKIAFTVDNISTGSVRLTARTYNTVNEVAAELQKAINEDAVLQQGNITVNVDVVNNRLKITSNRVGSNSVVDVNYIDPVLTALTGLVTAKGNTGTDLKANINGLPVSGKGNKLNLEGSLNGLVLEVSGKQTGPRGELTVTNGIAAILDDVTESFLESNGLIDTRIEGYNNRIKDIEKQRQDLVRKLEVSEERYLKQFSNLDAMLGKMRSTSNFLAEKLQPPSTNK